MVASGSCAIFSQAKIALALTVLFLSLSFTAGALAGGMDSSANTPSGYYHQMDSEQQAQFFQQLSQVKVGDSLPDVLRLLGKATADQTLLDKQGRFKARVLSYYIKRWEKDFVNELRDRIVRLEFDQNDQLVRLSSNVEGHQQELP